MNQQHDEDAPIVEDMQEGMSEVLGRFKQLEKEIETLGVNPANFERLRDLVEMYSDLQEELIAERKKQFYDTAWLFCSKMKIAQNKNVQALAVFLRLCARQWVRESLDLLHVEGKDLDAITDRLSNLPEELEGIPNASDRA